MKERKKLIITYIVIMIVLITFGVVSIFIALKSKKNTNSNVYVDIETLNISLSNEGLFDNNRMKNITKENVFDIFNINPEMIKNVIGKIPLADIYSGMYVVFEVDENNIEKVENLLLTYGNKYEKKWSTYMEDQYELVKERKIGHISNYVYMFISENSTEMVEILKAHQ